MIREFLRYALPSAIAMCIASFNTVLDGIFLGRGIGDSALAAVNLVFPLTIIFFGLATMFAVGGGALVSKYFGAGDEEKAINIFRQVVKLILIMSVSLSVVCMIFATPLVKALGASEALAPLAAEYLFFYSMFCIPSLLDIAFTSFLRNDNSPKRAMVATIIGTIINITLNYVFIFILGLGIKSAAIATGIGQSITLLIILPHFLLKKGKLTFGPSKISRSVLNEVSNIGFPSFFAEAAFSVIIWVHNLVIVNLIGDTGLSAYAIVNYITTNIYLIVLGVTLGAQPLMSYNYGAKCYHKIIQYYKLAVRTNLVISLGFLIICLVIGKPMISIFTNDPEIINITYIGLALTNLAYFFIGTNLTRTIFYQAIEQPKFSNLIGAMRSFLVLPFVLIGFTIMFGLKGAWISMAVSEGLTFIIICLIANTKRILPEAFINNKHIS
ncbi:MAG: MATE family efflux transporter [Clostridium sp.]